MRAAPAPTACATLVARRRLAVAAARGPHGEDHICSAAGCRWDVNLAEIVCPSCTAFRHNRLGNVMTSVDPWLTKLRMDVVGEAERKWDARSSWRGAT